jgi:hypothetical protein
MNLTGLSREALEEHTHRLEAEAARLRGVLEDLGGELAELAEPEEHPPNARDNQEYREALALIVAELEDLDLGDALGTARRVGELRAHVRTMADLSGMDPLYGLRALRRMRGEP